MRISTISKTNFLTSDKTIVCYGQMHVIRDNSTRQIKNFKFKWDHMTSYRFRIQKYSLLIVNPVKKCKVTNIKLHYNETTFFRSYRGL